MEWFERKTLLAVWRSSAANGVKIFFWLLFRGVDRPTPRGK